MRSLLKLTRARRLTDAQRDTIEADPELIALLVRWARRRGGATFPAEELVHDSLIVAAAGWDPERSRWRTWATSQVRWAFARYARARTRDRAERARLLAAVEEFGARAHGRPLRSSRGRARRAS